MRFHLSRTQAKAVATKKARAEARWRIVRDCSLAGGSKEEACRRAGLKPSGLNALLTRKVGSQHWPVEVDA